MKKQLLVGAFLLGSMFTASAQTQIFSVDFEDTTVLEDWFLIDSDGDEFGWGIQPTNTSSAANGFSGSFAASASYDNETESALTPDNSIVTQAFAIPADGATLTFKIGGIDAAFFAEHYAVYAVTDADFQAATGEFNDILDAPLLEETVGAVTATQKTVSLAAFQGQTMRLVFRHFQSTDQFFIALDDVTVTSGVLGTANVIANAFSVFPNPATDVINVSNSNAALVTGVAIVDLNGRTVKTAKFDGVANAQINVSDLSAGMYMMNVSSDKGTISKKIVKN